MSVDFKTLQIKQAGFASGMAKFLSKGLPEAVGKLNSGAKALGLANKNLPIGTSALGATVGAIRGASNAEDGRKGSGALVGGVLGGAIGYGAGKGLGTLPTIGKNTIPHYRGAGEALSKALEANPNMSAREMFTKGTSYMSRNFNDQWVKAPANAGTMKPMLGKEKPVEQILKGDKKSWAVTSLGSLSNTIEAGRTGGIKGIGKALWQDVKDQTMFSDKIKLPNGVEGIGRAHRSMIGQVGNVATMSGLGIGATEFAMGGKDEHGNVQPMGKRIMKGTGAALGWGLAKPVMVGKMMYDLPKSLMRGNKQPQLENNIQGV